MTRRCRVVFTMISLCLAALCHAAANERISATFAKTDGDAGIVLREQSPGNHYVVRLRDDKLEFVKVQDGEQRIMGARALGVGQSYPDGQQWTLKARASGHMISGSLENQDGSEVTSGTVFDRSFSEGQWRLLESDGIQWGEPQVEPLPDYITAADDLRGSYDVVIAGAGTGGSMAAVQAARLGASVLLVEETDWIGGQMAAAAVASMDEGAEFPRHGIDRNSVRERGLYREFYGDAQHLYGTIGISTDTCYVTENHFGLEPSTAQWLLYEMFQKERIRGGVIDVTLETSITKVRKAGNRVTGVELLVHTPDGKRRLTVESKILVDATEWGDVLPLAGVAYRVGTWKSDNIDMNSGAFPPIQDFTWTAVIEQYPGGAPENLILKTPPKGYDKAELKLALDNPEPTTSTAPWSWQRFVGYRGMPNYDRPDPDIKNPWARVNKTHMNVAANDAHIDVRDVENLDWRMHKEYMLKRSTLSLMYYFQNDMREPVRDWAVALNEGFDTPFNRKQNRRLIERFPDLAPYEEILNQFPPMAYARESRRMIGMYTMRAREIDRRTGPMVYPTSVAVGEYAVDLHGADTPDALEPDLDQPEDLGAIGFAGNQLGPFMIPFEAFIPKDTEGFLAAEKNISQSRLVSGATRLQPSTMLMGQAAGAIAALAIAQDRDPRDLHPAAVQKALLDTGSTLFAARYDAHKFPGVLLNTDLWTALQLCLLYGIVELGDAHQHMQGLEIVSGNTGASGWHVTGDKKLGFTGDSTGIALIKMPVVGQDGVTTSTADYTVSGLFTRSGGRGTVGLVGRFVDQQNFYHARLFGNRLEIYKWVKGNPTILASELVDYENGDQWKMTLQIQDDHVTASLLDQQGRPRKEISAQDASLTTGAAGLRVQPGGEHSARFASLEVQVDTGNSARSFRPEFHEPVNFSTDPLTRGQMALFLDRALGNLDAPEQDQRLNPSAPVTRADMAVALARALKYPLDQASSEPVFSDVPADHPAFASIQVLAEKQVGAQSLLKGDAFSPDQEMSIGDGLRFFADFIVNPPAVVPGQTVSAQRLPRELR